MHVDPPAGGQRLRVTGSGDSVLNLFSRSAV